MAAALHNATSHNRWFYKADGWLSICRHITCPPCLSLPLFSFIRPASLSLSPYKKISDKFVVQCSVIIICSLWSTHGHTITHIDVKCMAAAIHSPWPWCPCGGEEEGRWAGGAVINIRPVKSGLRAYMSSEPKRLLCHHRFFHTCEMCGLKRLVEMCVYCT